MEEYLRQQHKNDIIDLMNDVEDFLSESITVDLTHLCQASPNLFNDILSNVHVESLKWSQTLVEQQKLFAEMDEFLNPNYQIKTNARVRFGNLPEQDSRNRSTYPTNDNAREFVQIKGTVLRCTQAKYVEYKRDFMCGRCKVVIPVERDYAVYYALNPPLSCPNGCVGRPYCESSNFKNENCIKYQEIRIMEPITNKSMPSTISVTLENDLADSCQPGDSITVCGTVELRWSTVVPGKKTRIEVVIRANSVRNNMKQVTIGNDLPEHLICVRAEFQEFKSKFGELGARDIIVESICPDVHGMYLAKLAVALAVCSADDPSLAVSGLRNHSHLLLIGDPGLAKSRLLKFASSVSTTAIHTTGAGCSSAGLTAAAVKEDGEWHLEAGALVLADNGICCIDEFNLMSEAEKSSLLEAMEQQTISIAKADISCKLNTRCVIIAATNPKNLYSMSDEEGTTSINLGITSPLLSRFDLVLILRDERNVEWDTKVADHILLGTEITTNENLLDINKLQTHFTAVRDVNPTITDGAHGILKAYYMRCRADEQRDAGRTTLRLNDSLYRLAKAHAKLMFRYVVTEVDAVLAVMLMESSFGFGRILKPMNTVRQDFPLGPSDVQIKELMDKLQLETRTDTQSQTTDNQSPSALSIVQTNSNLNTVRIAPVVEKRREILRTTNLSQLQFKTRKIDLSSGTSKENISPSSTRQNSRISPQIIVQSHSAVPSMSSSVSHMFGDSLDENELDELFSLDSVIKTPINPAVKIPSVSLQQPQIELTSGPSPEQSIPPSRGESSGSSREQSLVPNRQESSVPNRQDSSVSNRQESSVSSQEQSQNQIKMLFPRFIDIDEDLACFDDEF